MAGKQKDFFPDAQSNLLENVKGMNLSNDEKYTINNSLLKLENGSIKLFSGKE